MQRSLFLIGLFSVLLHPAFSRPPAPLPQVVQLAVLDRQGQPVTQLMDGDRIRLRLELSQPAPAAATAQFYLDGFAAAIAECSLPSGEKKCESPAFSALGWYWGAPGTPQARRLLQVQVAGQLLPDRLELQIKPRPVVLVHGFISSWEAWQAYLGPQGFLSQAGLQGFAVGDGRAPGVLNTGNMSQPLLRTNTILQNAAVLQGYIAGVKQQTGAQMVDLVVHSMGGMISRVYIDHDMGQGDQRDVAQVIFLGTPNLGSDCANLPAALGWYLPASLEIRSSYASQILNPTFFHRKGVPFALLAGVPIVQPLSSPCTQVPSDGVVSLGSASAIPLEVEQIPLLHTNLPVSGEVFSNFVLPHLQRDPASFAETQADAAAAPAGSGGSAQGGPLGDPQGSRPALQFSQVFTGKVLPAGAQEVTIPIDAGVAVASFALHDPSQSLQVTVIGASGKVLPLDPVKNGLIEINDPAALVQLGYGFNNPKPGSWRVQLQATGLTPASGAEFAVMARFEGGAILEAQLDRVLLRIGEPVRITARLVLGSTSIGVEKAEARVTGPQGALPAVPLVANGDELTATWTPDQPGVYGVNIAVQAVSPEGFRIERAAFLSAQVGDWDPAPDPHRLQLVAWGAGLICLAGLVLIGAGLWAWRAKRRASSALS